MIERYKPYQDMTAAPTAAPVVQVVEDEQPEAKERLWSRLRSRIKPGATVGEVLDAAEAEAEAKEVAAGSKRRGKAHWAAWVMSAAAVGVVVGLVIVGILKFLNGPAEANINTELSKARASVAPRPVTSELAGQSIAMSYPGIFDQVNNLNKTQNAYDQYYISSRGNPSRTISIAVINLEATKIDNDSSYKFRTLHPEMYKQTTEKLMGETVYIMTKTDGTEQTLFWPHKGKCLNIAITSTDPHDKVAEFMKVIKPTIRWRQ